MYRVRDAALEIAIDEAPEALDGTLRLERLANETSHKRLVDAVRDVGKVGEGGAGVDLARFPGARLVEVLFGSRRPRFASARSTTPREEREKQKDETAAETSVRSVPPFKPINRDLDRSQRDAVSNALEAEDVALIHGPPGTGKTTAVVEYVLQERQRGRRVLCCAASNVAVDTLVERLLRGDRDDDSFRAGSTGLARKSSSRKKSGAEKKDLEDRRRRDKTARSETRENKPTKKEDPVFETLIRLGHPARLLPSVLSA